MMGAGCILVGRREESGKGGTTTTAGAPGRGTRRSEDGVGEETVDLLGGDEYVSDAEEEGEDDGRTQSGKRSDERDDDLARF